MDCIFCKIINGEIPGKFIFEDDIVACFMDTNPVCDGHILIVPKKHIEDYTKVDNDTLKHMYEIAEKISDVILKATGEKGYTLLINYGDKQNVKHLHMHFLPNYTKRASLTVDEMYEKLNSY